MIYSFFFGGVLAGLGFAAGTEQLTKCWEPLQ